jgi:hypothetical protein
MNVLCCFRIVLELSSLGHGVDPVEKMFSQGDIPWLVATGGACGNDVLWIAHRSMPDGR